MILKIYNCHSRGVQKAFTLDSYVVADPVYIYVFHLKKWRIKNVVDTISLLHRNRTRSLVRWMRIIVVSNCCNFFERLVSGTGGHAKLSLICSLVFNSHDEMYPKNYQIHALGQPLGLRTTHDDPFLPNIDGFENGKKYIAYF